MINELERKAMNLLLAGEEPVLAALRAQYQEASIKSIEYTGAGVYINYDVPNSVVNLPKTLNFRFGDIEGHIDSLKHKIGFLLWIENGVLSFLEIYTYDESFPSEITDFKLGYIEGERNLNKLKESWQKP
jgi:hypothetical protein